MIIDQEILQSLPENGSIVQLLPRTQNDQIIDEISTDEESDDGIGCTFVPLLPPTHRESVSIDETLHRMKAIIHLYCGQILMAFP